MMDDVKFHKVGQVLALRYITTDGRIEMCWPCRVVVDTPELVALFISSGSPYKAGPKKTAAEKKEMKLTKLPSDEYIWRKDTLRLMFPNQNHSVSLFWDEVDNNRIFSKYFVNMEEPFRRTEIGFDTQDHTLDVVVTPTLNCSWRDVGELDNHVKYGFYTKALAEAARAEGESVIDAISTRVHPCLNDWSQWTPNHQWQTPDFPKAWATTPVTFWEKRLWAYGFEE